MKVTIIYALLLIFARSYAQNPLVPPGIYMADPAARVWKDGRIYLYCSVDESIDWYCSKKYHILSSDDMIHWDLHKNTFSTIGENDAVPYNDNLLYAPDCMFKDGKYYLYYCQPDRDHAEGIAVSDNPYGPFKNGRPLDTGPYNQIDPAIFVDDDGQTYYVWGQFTMKMAKLKANMFEIDTSSIQDSVITQNEHFFHEGSSMTKRNGIYYLVYADMSRGQTPTCIGYATSEHPMGPYKYRGVIIDNDHSDPHDWNNHGSIAEFHGKWYVFYHRATHNGEKMRKACVEPIEFDKNGSISEVEMTSQGAGPAINAYTNIEAERSCWMFGNVRIEAISENNEALCKIKNRDRAAFKYIDFEDGAIAVEMNLMPGRQAGVILLKLDYPWGEKLAQIDVPAATENKQWITLSSEVSNVSGIHALWLEFYSNDKSDEFDCSINMLKFRKD